MPSYELLLVAGLLSLGSRPAPADLPEQPAQTTSVTVSNYP
jgi:hypothetical protein